MFGKTGVKRRVNSHVKLPNLPLNEQTTAIIQRAQNSSSQKILKANLHYRGKSDNNIHVKASQKIDDFSLSKGNQASSFFIKEPTKQLQLEMQSKVIKNQSKRNLRVSSSIEIQQIRKKLIGVKLKPLRHFIQYQGRDYQQQNKQLKRASANGISATSKVRIMNAIKLDQQGDIDIRGSKSKSKVKQIKRKGGKGKNNDQNKSGESLHQKSLQKNYTTKSSSGINSPSAISNPIMSKLKVIIPEKLHEFLSTDKIQKKNIGNLSQIYWCLVNSIIISISKCIQSRISCFQLSKAYSKLSHQIFFLEEETIRRFQDIGQRKVIIEYFLYEKTVIYSLAVIKDSEVLTEQTIKIILTILEIVKQNRKLIIQMVVQAIQLDKKAFTLKKPKYMAKQKKIIQISKYNAIVKELLFKNGIIDTSPKKDMFLIQNQLVQFDQLQKIDSHWKNKVFNTPIPPFLGNLHLQPQKMILIIDPQNFLFKFDQQNELFYLRPFTQQFLKSLQPYFHLIIFTCMSKADTENFIRNLGLVKFDGFLYRKHITYQQCKRVKDIKKAIQLPSQQSWKWYKDDIVILDRQEFYTEEFKQKIWQISSKTNQDYLMSMAKQLIQHAYKIKTLKKSTINVSLKEYPQ